MICPTGASTLRMGEGCQALAWPSVKWPSVKWTPAPLTAVALRLAGKQAAMRPTI